MKKALLLMLCIVAGISAVNAGCGDYLGTIETHGGSDHIVLGIVSLPTGDTYLSCRNLCRNAHPDFQFYHKFINYQSCECKKMADGVAIALKPHGAYTFGWARECECSSHDDCFGGSICLGGSCYCEVNGNPGDGTARGTCPEFYLCEANGRCTPR